MLAYYFVIEILTLCMLKTVLKSIEKMEIRGHKKSLTKVARLLGGAEWARTTDSRIFSPMLYQLSYSTLLRGCKTI